MNLNIPLQVFVNAHAGTSFSPERRGEQALAGYSSELAAYLAKMAENAAKGGTADLLAEQQERFAAGYSSRVRALMCSRSRIMSTMITGGSNFPVRRMNKRNDIADRRMEELSEFCRKAMKSALRVLRPDLRPIMSGDADAIDRLEAELAKAQRAQDRMKQANAVIRKFKKAGPSEQIPNLMILGFSEAIAVELLKPDFCGRIGFADYQLQNNGASIRRVQARIEQLQAAKAAPVVEVEGENGIRLEDDPPANRVRLFFPGKPDAAVRDQLKAGGWRWAPSLGAWQAYRNWRTLELAKKLAGPAVVEAEAGEKVAA